MTREEAEKKGEEALDHFVKKMHEAQKKTDGIVGLDADREELRKIKEEYLHEIKKIQEDLLKGG